MKRFVLAGLLALAQALPALAQSRDPVVQFDPQNIDAREVDGHWWLFTGQTKFKDLGASEHDALEALWLIRDLHLTHHGTVGSPQPVIEYWLSEGRPPQGGARGGRVVPFNPAALRVDEVQGQWCLCDGKQPMFGFGLRATDAHQAQALIRHYGFNRIGYVGQPTPILMYFFVTDEPPPKTVASPKAEKGPPPLAMTLPLFQLCVPGLNDNDSPDRIVFDPRRVEVRRIGPDWKLMIGDRCLANFGQSEDQARDGLRLVEFYHFTEQRHFGPPEAPLTYYLVNGEAPRGLMLGLSNREFRADDMEARQQGALWYLCERGQPILAAGKSKEDAEHLLQLLQRYEFDHVCQLGQPGGPVMTFLVRDR